MPKYYATFSNNVTATRKSDRVYTHAVTLVYVGTETLDDGYTIFRPSWAGRPDLVPGQISKWKAEKAVRNLGDEWQVEATEARS